MLREAKGGRGGDQTGESYDSETSRQRDFTNRIAGQNSVGDQGLNKLSRYQLAPRRHAMFVTIASESCAQDDQPVSKQLGSCA